MDLASGACKQLRWTEKAIDNPIDLLAWNPSQPTNNSFEVGSFVLVPYSNRLFGGQLLSPNGTLTLPRNHPHSDVPVHGIGWQKNWQLVSSEPQRLVLGYSHLSDTHWPYDHSCEQTVTLKRSHVQFNLKLLNLSEQSMPAGLGFHPWFALDKECQLRFGSSTVWLQDARGWPMLEMPTSGQQDFDFSRWRKAHAVIQNHCHSRWSGLAELKRPEKKLSLQISASPNLNHLIVYRKPGQDWLCLEPVSHATGAMSLPHVKIGHTGHHILAPGESMEVWMRININPLTT